MQNPTLSLRITRRLPRVVGRLNRILVRAPLVGRRAAAGVARRAGTLLPRISALGFERGSSYELAVKNWENFLFRIGAEYEREETDDEVAYTFAKCPAGMCTGGHLDACLATMELDHALVRASGAELVVDKRIPTDGVCVEKVVRRR